MSERTQTIQQLIEQGQELVKTQLAIYKLRATAKTADISGSVVAMILVGLAGLFFLLFISLGLAFWLTQLLNSTALGFTAVAVIYLLIALILYSIRRTTLKTAIADAVVGAILNDKDEEKHEENQ